MTGIYLIAGCQSNFFFVGHRQFYLPLVFPLTAKLVLYPPLLLTSFLCATKISSEQPQAVFEISKGKEAELSSALGGFVALKLQRGWPASSLGVFFDLPL